MKPRSQFLALFALVLPCFTLAIFLLASTSSGVLSAWCTACLPILKSENSPIEMNDEQISWLISLQYLGSTVSSIPSGIIMDRYGTKLPFMIFSVILPPISWLLIYLTSNWHLLLASTFLSGLWTGSLNTMSPIYLGEIAEPDSRGRIMTLYNACYRIGTVYALIISLFIQYKNLPIFYSIFTILFILSYPLVPESPYHYIKKDDKISAKKSLIWLRNDKTDNKIEEELTDIEKFVNTLLVNKNKNRSNFFNDLISLKNNLNILFIIQSLTILQRTCGLSSIISYIPLILPKNILIEPLILIMIIDILRTITAIISSHYIDRDRIRSKVVLNVTSFICFLMMFITGLWYYLNSKNVEMMQLLIWIPFVCILIHGLSFTFGINQVCNKYKSELLPPKIKGTCSAITWTVLSLTEFFISKMFLYINNEHGEYVNFWIYGASCILMILFSYKYLIETAGKTLQQIQDELHKKLKIDSDPKKINTEDSLDRV